MNRQFDNSDSALGSRIKQLDRDLREMSSGTRCVTKADAQEIHTRIIGVLKECTEDVQQRLDVEARRVLPELRALSSPERMERKRIRVNYLSRFGPKPSWLVSSERACEKTRKITQELSLRINQLELDKRQLLSGKRYVEDVDALMFHERLEGILSKCTKSVRARLDTQAKISLGLLEPIKGFADFERAIEQANAVWARRKRTQELAPSLGRELLGIADELSDRNYIRRSASGQIKERIATTVEQCSDFVGRYLSQEAKDALERLTPLARSDIFEAERERLNEVYIRSAIACIKRSADDNLTDEQAEAIATDEDVTLVLAGAGTGKTYTIVGKVEHLVRNRGVSPKEILVLAYNNAAASELRQRLPKDIAAAKVATFHAFGGEIINESEERRYSVSKLARDEKLLRKAIENIIEGLLKDPRHSSKLRLFFSYHLNHYSSPFDFATPEGYRQYVRSIERRTLSGDRVKSFEELIVANFLSLNGIKFIYENPYLIETATRKRRQYRPDFYLPDYDIYIEHFAVDEDGCTPKGWEGYYEGMQWKRNLHKQNGTTLVETYSWQCRRQQLFSMLRRNLERRGVVFDPISDEELIKKLAQPISLMSNLIRTFLQHFKTANCRLEDLRERAEKREDTRRNLAFLNVFEHIHMRYELMLKDENSKDYHDLINQAVVFIEQGRWVSPYKYIIVDEFQDISSGRMRLIKGLNGPGVAYFLVGDDWQSIYRFAGSDVALVNSCGEYLGHVKKRELTQTFRFASGILEPSSAFIMRNPQQTKRTLIPRPDVEDGGISAVPHVSVEGALLLSIRDIASRVEGEQVQVLVLGRYNDTLEKLQHEYDRQRSLDDWGHENLKLDFKTVHKAKGMEKDYVVVIDLKDDRRGFPSKMQDDPIMNLVLPPASDGALPFAEERRLFYVAMTRARIGAYLVADATQPSAFVEELQTYSNIKTVGEFTEKCPTCGVGVLVETKGPYSTFMGCTEYWADPSCKYKRPIQVNPEDASDEEFWRRFSAEGHLGAEPRTLHR